MKQPVVRAGLIALAVTAIWGTTNQSLAAQALTAARHADEVEFARALITAAMEESGTPGMSVAVGIGGKIVWAEGFGYADLENKVSVWQETKFRIGSVSKPITGTAVGLLVEQGKLDLDAPVQRYVPTFPEKRWPITTRQAAGHLAGIRHYAGDEFLSTRHYETVAQGLTIFQDDTLLFQPGERVSYSSYGWNLVSAVIEGATGQDFLSYMQQQVFEPIGMRHTVGDFNDSIIPHRTGFYQRADDGRIVNAPYVDNSYKLAGGGFLSTPSDLVRFGFAYFGEDLMRAETIAELWTPMTTNDGKSTGYGVGWAVGIENGVVVRAGHGGGSIGGTAGFDTRPPERAVVALVGNMSGAPTSGLIVTLIMEAFLEPERLTQAAPGRDMAGEFRCSLMDGDEMLPGHLAIGGSAPDIWGRFEWNDDSTSRVIYSSGNADKIRLVTVDQAARLKEITFTTVDTNELSGTWRGGGNGTLTCRN